MTMLRRMVTGSRVGACLILALVVAACSGNITRGPLTDLHMLGVRRVANLEALQFTYQIEDVAAYADPNTGNARIMFQTDQLYTIGLDGRDLRAIKGAPECGYFLAITLDGRRVMCSSSAVGLHTFSLGYDDTATSGQAYGSLGDDLFAPAWSPDGRLFAVVNHSPQSGCAISLFPIATKGGVARPIATLAIPMFSISNAISNTTRCEVSRLAWSRDGAWLALAGQQPADGYDWGVYVLSLASIPQLSESTASAPVNLTVAQSDLTRIGEMHYFTTMAWSTQAGQQLLTYLEGRELAIVQVEPHSGVRTPFLQLPSIDVNSDIDYGVTCGLAWTPDNAHLVFVQCGPGNIEVHPAASKLYVYTPPDA
jgi:hypothetical protein